MIKENELHNLLKFNQELSGQLSE